MGKVHTGRFLELEIYADTFKGLAYHIMGIDTQAETEEISSVIFVSIYDLDKHYDISFY